VIIGVVGMVAVILLLGIPAAKAKVQRANCADHLATAAIALREFTTDHANAFPWRVSTNKGGSMEYGSSAYPHWLTLKDGLASPEDFVSSVVICPADKRRGADKWADMSNSNLSYFISLDAADDRPEMVLAGDRNLTLNGAEVVPGLATLGNDQTLSWNRDLHGGRGNLLFADGHVAWFSRLRLTSNHLSTNLINRLAVP